MKRYAAVVLCLLVVVAGASSAYAEEAKKNYVVGKFGAYFPSSNDLDHFDSTGYNVEVAFGRYLMKNLAIEVGVGAIGLGSDDVLGYNTVFGAYSYSDTLSIVPLTFSLKAVFPIGNKVEVYGIGGIGAYFINFDRDYDSSTLGNNLSYSEDKTAFGGLVGAGGAYNITARLFVGGELKYHFISHVDFAPPLGGSRSYDLSGFVGTVNVGFRF
jgi:opacity protein-like surface antigen